MRTMRSDYMHWAKFKPPVRYPLTGSEVPHFRMDSLPVTIADLDLDGASHPRYPPLREAIAGRYGVPVDQVVAADGTSMANFLAMAALISPGDEVLIELPTYELLLGAASFLGAEIKRFERKPEDAFRLDPATVEEAMSDRTRLIVITNLHNPSGALASEDELRSIGQLGARILVDEVYLDSAVPAPSSAVHLGPEFVCTNSLTKVYGLSGLRCGWIVAEPELTERMWRLNDLFGVNQAHPAERLACIAFERIDEVIGGNPDLLARNRHRWNAFAESRDDLDCIPANHGITAFPRWRGGDTHRLDALLRERYDTSVVPGRWFEMPDHFRVGFGVPLDDFEEALGRLGAALDDLT
ncbi:pyridoxal phosphate-dependent aminotransferase [Sphingomonas segetis]|uniref:pyridoxal phosphate-dependent aminotransferase n=1 Tax=Sphingomonas segetis TaxID=1104779 RepID=UPI0012D2F5A7|nr:pyridoxal phosphate-dependent aminotransferase [Sphingomonas segetis]